MVLKVDLDAVLATTETLARLLQEDAAKGKVVATLVVEDGKYTLALAPFGPIIEDSIQ